MSTHKRKRSLQDSPVDVSKMRKALLHLQDLKEELDGFEETEKEMKTIMHHVEVLQDIIQSAKLPKISFSNLKEAELTRLGITPGLLSFDPERLIYLQQNNDIAASAMSLKAQLLEIHDRVNMDYEAGSRMILDAVLLMIGRIASNADSSMEVAIFPEMRISPDGVCLRNGEYQVCLTGSVDYAVIQYKNVLNTKERLLSCGGVSRGRKVFKFSQERLFLVEAKRAQGSSGSPLASHIPEAVGQAVAWATTTEATEVHFCLSDGQTWLFFILKKDESGRWVYYESPPRQLTQEGLSGAEGLGHVSELLLLILEWLHPSVTGDLCILGSY